MLNHRYTDFKMVVYKLIRWSENRIDVTEEMDWIIFGRKQNLLWLCQHIQKQKSGHAYCLNS